MGSQIARPLTFEGKPSKMSADLAIWRFGDLAMCTENFAVFSLNLEGAQM